MGLVLREKLALASCRREMVGTYVDCSIAIADPNGHRNTLDRQDSKVVQDRVTIRTALEYLLESKRKYGDQPDDEG